jgi:hypothetical protein
MVKTHLVAALLAMLRPVLALWLLLVVRMIRILVQVLPILAALLLNTLLEKAAVAAIFKVVLFRVALLLELLVPSLQRTIAVLIHCLLLEHHLLLVVMSLAKQHKAQVVMSMLVAATLAVKLLMLFTVVALLLLVVLERQLDLLPLILLAFQPHNTTVALILGLLKAILQLVRLLIISAVVTLALLEALTALSVLPLLIQAPLFNVVSLLMFHSFLALTILIILQIFAVVVTLEPAMCGTPLEESAVVPSMQWKMLEFGIAVTVIPIHSMLMVLAVLVIELLILLEILQPTVVLMDILELNA